MNIRFIASDSMGVRSMATIVETSALKIFIDPSAALGPSRYGLPPSAKENEALMQSIGRIIDEAINTDIMVISHYHFDHYDPDRDIFRNKTLLLKNPEVNINKSQSVRASSFLDILQERYSMKHADDIDKNGFIYADGKTFKHGKTIIDISEAVPHGPDNSRLGYVVMTRIKEEKTFIHTSDIQGPVSEKTADIIIDWKPDVLYIDGPPTLFLGWKFSMRNLEKAVGNLKRIIDETGAEVIMDHHSHRVKNYTKYYKKLYDSGLIKTAAEYMGMENRFLEAWRKDNYYEDIEKNAN